MMKQGPRVLLASLLLLAACGSPEEYLADLERFDPAPRAPSFDEAVVVFDQGQIAHEALTGLATAEEMTFPQALRALAQGADYLLKARDDALLQSDAAVLVGRITTRLPVPPLDAELPITEDIVDTGIAQFTTLLEARRGLAVPTMIETLSSPDAVAREEALDGLRQVAGRDLGTDPEDWRAWWAEEEPGRRARFVEESREPLETLGRMRFRSARNANALFNALALFVDTYTEPALEDVAVPAVMRIGRQTAVLSLGQALVRSEHAQARADAAAAMGEIRDPAFGEVLIERLPRERDAYAAAAIVRSLRHYPSRRTILSVFGAMAVGDRLVGVAGNETLSSITGQAHGEDLEAWARWWEEEGDRLWP